MVRCVSILNFKGGVGKTSTAINLGYALAKQGKRVVLVDCDRQRNTTSILGEVQGPTLKEVLTGDVPLPRAIYEARTGLFVVPAHNDLEKAAKHISTSGPKTLKLLRTAVNVLHGYDLVLYDHAPSYSPITDAVLLASDEMIIPVELEPFSVEGLVDMLNKLTQSLDELEHEVAITGIVPTNLNFSKAMTQLYLNSLKKRFEGRVTVPIRTDAQISKSQSKHITVFEYDPASKGAKDYLALAEDLLLRWEVTA
jgi:chromosome partitioning protein